MSNAERARRAGRRGAAGTERAGGAASRKAARVDLAAVIARLPRPAPAALAVSLAGILAGNAWLLWRIAHGELRLSGLVLLVLAEGVLLSLLAAMQRRGVPAEHRMLTGYEHYGLPGKALGWAGCIAGIGGAYAVWAVVLNETDVLRGFLGSLAAWHAADLDVALGITAAFAVAGWIADRRHYRRAGPPFVSTVDMEATARRLVFVYGAIVIAIPMIGTVALALWAIPRLLRGRDGPHWNLVGGLAVIAVFFGTFYALAATIDSGPFGWAAVYLWGKVLVEGLFVLMPLLARRAAAHAQDSGVAPVS